jgi:hypothetical protein
MGDLRALSARSALACLADLQPDDDGAVLAGVAGADFSIEERGDPPNPSRGRGSWAIDAELVKRAGGRGANLTDPEA